MTDFLLGAPTSLPKSGDLNPQQQNDYQSISRTVRLFEVAMDQKSDKLMGSDTELGQLFLNLKFKVNSFDFRLFQEARLVQKHYFDPFLFDQETIKFNLGKVEEILALRTHQWESTIAENDRITGDVQDLAVELAELRARDERQMSQI